MIAEAIEKVRQLMLATHPKPLTWLNQTKGQSQAVIVPQGHTVHVFSNEVLLPERVKQTVVFDELDSFAAYLNRFGNSEETVIFLEQTSTNITMDGVLDYHEPTEENGSSVSARWCQNLASFRPALTKEWELWSSHSGKWMEQAVFAEFLEENGIDVVEPASGKLIEICRNLEINQTVKFRKAFRKEDGYIALEYTEDAKPVQQIEVPREMVLRIKPYQGEGFQDVTCAVRYRLNSGEVRFCYEMQRPEKVLDAVATEMREQIRELTREKNFPIFSGKRQ